MANIDVSFSRSMLVTVHRDVKKLLPDQNLWREGAALHSHADYWTFEGPDGFQWYGQASNAYDCRYRWCAWLAAKGVKEYGAGEA